MLDNIDGYYGLIADEWKLVNGTVRRFNGTFDNFLGVVEEFPTPKSYTNSILTSNVGKVLEKSKLSAKKILNLRKSATIACNENHNPINKCDLMTKPCLFNIINDPCERRNLAETYPEVLQVLLKRLKDLSSSAVPVRRTFVSDRQSDPNLHNRTWASWIADTAWNYNVVNLKIWIKHTRPFFTKLINVTDPCPVPLHRQISKFKKCSGYDLSHQSRVKRFRLYKKKTAALNGTLVCLLFLKLCQCFSTFFFYFYKIRKLWSFQGKSFSRCQKVAVNYSRNFSEILSNFEQIFKLMEVLSNLRITNKPHFEIV